MAGEADTELTMTASACHIGGPNSVTPGQILLVYGTLCPKKKFKYVYLATDNVSHFSENGV